MNTVYKNKSIIHEFRELSFMIPIWLLKSGKLFHEIMKQDHELSLCKQTIYAKGPVYICKHNMQIVIVPAFTSVVSEENVLDHSLGVTEEE